MSIQVRSNVFFENIFHTYLDLEIMSTTHTLYLNGVAVSGTNSLSIVNNKLSGLVAPTADTDAANMGYVKQQISELVGSAPELLNTLHELSLAIGSDPNFASSTANLIGVNTSTIANEISRATAAEAAAKSEAIVAAAADATTKAANAQSAAVTAAAADAATRANAAQANAISAAALDATTKANTAKSEAIAAAATDATTKANAVQAAAATDASTKASNAKVQAENSAAEFTLARVAEAKADASSKADTAKSEAIAAAALDATTKANTAQAAAIAAASSALSAVQTSTNENHSELVAHVQAIWDYFFAPRVDGIPKTQPERYVAPA